MSAHIRPFQTTCATSGCRKRATCTVFNTYNAPLGNYCRRHGQQHLKLLLAGEREWAQRSTAPPERGRDT